MPLTATRPVSALLLFAGVTTAVYATALVLAGRLSILDRPGTVALGLTLDMVVLVPVSFYFLVIRRTRLPWVTLVPVIIVSLLVAARVLPADHHRTLNVLEGLAVPLELGLLAWVGWKATRAFGGNRARRDDDPLARYHEAAQDLVRQKRAAALVASEIAMFHYGLGAWRASPHVPPNTHPFSHHERSGHGGIVLGILMLLAVEGFAVHFLLMKWSVVAAWIFTLSTVYGALWLIADFRATVLRPILVGEDAVVFRAGLRATLRVPRAAIVAVGRQAPKSKQDLLKLSFLGEPTVWVSLAEPMLAEGPYGTRRRVRVIGVDPDQAEAFVSAMGAPMAVDHPSPSLDPGSP